MNTLEILVLDIHSILRDDPHMIDKVTEQSPAEEQEALTGAVVEPAEEAPKDLRTSLREAFREHSIDEGDAKGEEDKSKPAVKTDDDVASRMAKARDAKAAQAAARKASTQSAPVDATKSAQQSGVQPVTSKPVDPAQPKAEAPPFWKSKGKEVWDKLTPDAQQAIINREQEVSNGFAQYGPKVRAFDDLARVIEPHLPAIQRFGVTVPQTIDRLFGWMNALSHPNDSQRMEAFKALAQSFRVNLAQLVPGQQGQQLDTLGQQPAEQGPPNWFSEYHNHMQQRIMGLEAATRNAEQAQQAQTVNAASTYLETWAKDKPYYEQVRHQMKYLIETGQISNLANGALDLDTAYNHAVQFNVGVQAQVKKDAEAKAQAEANAAAKKKAEEAAARLARAKRAGSSIRPAQAMVMTAPPGSNGARAPSRPSSVGESLRSAIRELSDQ